MSDPLRVVADDKFLSAVGGLGAVMSGFGKLLGGQLADKIGFLKGYTATTVLQVATMLLLPYTAGNRAAFAAAVCSALFCLGSSIAMYVTCNAQTFGTRNAGEIYSVLFSALALASVTGAKLTAVLLGSVGWSGVFKVLAAMGLANLGFLALLRSEVAKPAPWSV